MYRLHYLLWLGLLCIAVSCKRVQHLSTTDVKYIETVEVTGEDPELLDLIKPYREKMTEEMDVILGDLSETLYKNRPNSNLGNWFADVLLYEADQMFFKEVDIALQNYGGLRVSSVAAGPLTKGEIYELMPFDNTLVVLEMAGDTLEQLVQAVNSKGGWPMSYTLSYTSTPQGAQDIMVKGKLLDRGKSYRVVLPDYVANGGDQADFLKDIPQEDSGVYIRDIIISHLEVLQEEGKPIIIDNSKRVH